MQIDTAESGKECLRRITQEKYHIIFLDHMMPDMDGIETLKNMKWVAENKNTDTPVIMLTANAINMRNDVVISAGVLLGLIFTFIFKLPILDSITGLIISLFIIKSSIGIFLDSNVELMDGVKDVNVYNKIFEAVEKVPGASNPHRVRSRMIGNRYIITLDIEVNPQITITQAHEIAGAVEKSIESSVDNVYDILVHVEPAGECQTDEKFGVDKDMV